VTLEVFLCGGILVWSGARRFGAARAPVPAIEASKAYLIENSAELLRLTGRSAPKLRRYLEDAMRAVGKAYYGGADLDAHELASRLAELGRRREPLTALDDIVARTKELSARADASPPEVLELAGRIHHWKEAMLHGAGSRPRSR